MKRLLIPVFLSVALNANAQVLTCIKAQYDLPGGKDYYLETPEQYPEEGTTVISILVGKDGDVIDAQIDSARTTVKDYLQNRDCRRAARRSSFIMSEPADSLQGRIIYTVTKLSKYHVDSLQTELIVGIKESISSMNKKSSHELYKTDNIWTFLELDTRYGFIWQLHFNVNSGVSGSKHIVNANDLRGFSRESVPGRFKLYKTENMYNFILLDTFDGRTWQVQWSYDDKSRGIVEQIK